MNSVPFFQRSWVCTAWMKNSVLPSSRPGPRRGLVPPVTASTPKRKTPRSGCSNLPRGKSEPFSLSRDGHVVGTDGFVVPATFEEFVVRFPNHVRNFVRRHMPHRQEQDIRERESDLLCFLMVLPERSIYRRRGMNGRANGCIDRVMAFNPVRSHGASKARFLAFVNCVLRNRFISLEESARHDPVTNLTTLHLVEEEEGGERIEAHGQISFDHLAQIMSGQGDADPCGPFHVVEVSGFLYFVALYNPELLSVVQHLLNSARITEAQKCSGLSHRDFTRACPPSFCCVFVLG